MALSRGLRSACSRLTLELGLMLCPRWSRSAWPCPVGTMGNSAGKEAAPRESPRAVRDGNRERDDTNATSAACLLSESVECIDGVLWHECHQKEIRTSENEDEDEEERLRGALPSDRWMLRKERAPLVRQSRTPKSWTSWKPRRGEKGTSKGVCVCVAVAVAVAGVAVMGSQVWSHLGRRCEEHCCKPHGRRACVAVAGELGGFLGVLACGPAWAWR